MINKEEIKKSEKIILNVKIGLLEQIKEKLKDCDNDEIYFHDLVFKEIDSQTPTDKKVCIELIDLADSSLFDSGLIDNSNLDRFLITSAYCSIEQVLFNDDFIQELQNELNNERISKTNAKEIIKRIDKELLNMGYKPFKSIYEDNNTQIFLNVNFSIGSLTKGDFLKYGLIDKQVLDLSDSIKILTSNKSINKNALVIEETKRDITKKNYLFRIYLMEKNKEIDIRNLFKLKTISEETGFNLSPSAYIEQTTEQYEKDKKSNIKNYLSSFKDKTTFIKQIVSIANNLTKISINNSADKWEE